MLRRCGRIGVLFIAVAAGTVACSGLGSTCTNVLTTRQPSPLAFPTVIVSPMPAPANTGPPPPRLSEDDDKNAWAAVVNHAQRSSGGRFTMTTQPGPPGYVPPAHPRGNLVTLEDATTYASYGYSVESYTGPIELVLPSRAANGAITTVALRGRVVAMNSVRALVDLRDQRLVLFVPPVLETFEAEDAALYEPLAAIERVCTRRGVH